jgi:dipeptidyl aminopeptidase/acylaminoacyl peptidase
VPPEMSERFAAAARRAGDDVQMAIEPEEEHLGHIDPANPLWRAVIEWLA